MPSKEAHLAAARANQGTIDYLRKDAANHLAWITTVAFYKALHIVEAVLATDSSCPVDHTDDHKARGRLLKTTARYSKIWEMYRELYQASMIARYLRENAGAPTYDVFATYMPLATVESKILGHYLHQVEKSAGTLLGNPNFLDP